jgi:cyclopropane-fatty-acyl-phospholipid synthase
MSGEERMLVYQDFFSRCKKWLPAGGRVALQSIVTSTSRLPDKQTIEEARFIFKHIFPESAPPRLSDLILASEHYFDVVSLRNDPDDYARTCQTWHDTLLARRNEAEEVVGQQKVADFLYYLSASARQFRDRRTGLVRVILERR